MVRFVELARKTGFDTPEMRRIEAKYRNENQLISDNQFEVAIAPQNSQADDHVALLQKRQAISGYPHFGTNLTQDEMCDANDIFLRTFQHVPHGIAQRYASAYCLL